MSTRAWSGEYDEQYSHRPGAYPTLNRFYRDLFAGGLEFQLIKTFKVYPSLFRCRLNDDRAALTFRLFDHPKLMIFERRRTPEGSRFSPARRPLGLPRGPLWSWSREAGPVGLFPEPIETFTDTNYARVSVG